MLSDTELYYTVLSHQQAVLKVRKQVTGWVERYWGTMSSWRDADIERMVRYVVPVIETGQRTVYRLTDAYLTTVAMEMGDVIPKRVVAPSLTFRGISGREVYARPGTTIYKMLSEGKPLDQAVNAGLERLKDLATTDLQLAQTHAARDVFSRSDRIVGYERVLTGAEDCLLCTIASTQRYRRGDLMPIHPGCDCTVAPIYGESDPGRVINEQRYLEATNLQNLLGVDTHQWSGEQYAKHMADREAARVTIRYHGEYGPTLSWKDQAFTGPSGLK